MTLKTFLDEVDRACPILELEGIYDEKGEFKGDSASDVAAGAYVIPSGTTTCTAAHTARPNSSAKPATAWRHWPRFSAAAGKRSSNTRMASPGPHASFSKCCLSRLGPVG